MNRVVYIYRHTSPSGKVYIGQSVNPHRRWGSNGEHYRNKKENGDYVQPTFARAINKYGWKNFTHELILECKSKREADYSEKYLIKWYKLHNISYNITDGGEGTLGHKYTPTIEHRNKISKALRLNHPMRGKHHSPEALAKITIANRNRVYTEEQKKKIAEKRRQLKLGTKASEETKKKLSNYRKAHPETWIGGWNAKEVHQYDFNGNYITSFSSASEASISIIGNDKAVNDILKCSENKKPSAIEYVWRFYKTDLIDLSGYKIISTKFGKRLLDMSPEAVNKRRTKYHKPVNQYSLDGAYIATYDSTEIAAEKTNIGRSGIGKCCKNPIKNKTSGGFIWRYDTIDNRNNITNK